jgi:hypothetical protein
VAVGYGALYDNRSGINSVAVGGCSLFRSLGNTNTGIGTNAGICITTGACNVIIGGASALGFETQSNNIFISDGAGNIRIFATGSTGAVGVNTTAPQATLHVNGDTIISSSLFSSVLTGSLATGTTLIYSVNTGSYNAGFFDYYAISGSNGRAGTVMSFWSGSQIQYTDNSTPDVGNTSNFAFSMSLAGSNAQLFASASSDSWTVKTSFRTF